jgi:restriction system protein
MERLIQDLALEFNMPTLDDNTRIWFIRTHGGTFYEDFKTNNFIALGWNEISKNLIVDTKLSQKEKKARVIEIYPKESRPGLILGQLDVFYNQMQLGDLIVIPSYRSEYITVGKIGEVIPKTNQTFQLDDYARCGYEHRRRVDWMKTVVLGQDIYLFKALRAQQTISAITDCAGLVCRNLFPCYISNNMVHLTLQKTTDTDYNLAMNIRLLSNISEIIDKAAEMYGVQTVSNDIYLKTAVGSKGFMEFIFPLESISVVSVGLIAGTLYWDFAGGVTVATVGAAVMGINKVLNDHKSRQKIDAEIRNLEASTKKAKAEVHKIEAEARKIEKETKQMDNDGKVLIIPASAWQASKISEIEVAGRKLNEAAESSGVRYPNSH